MRNSKVVDLLPIKKPAGVTLYGCRKILRDRMLEQQDDIRTEYHQCSGIPIKTDHFADFHCHTAAPSLIPKNTTPWEPFSLHIDFNFAELILKANLTKLQMNELISLICHAVLERFSVINYDGICKLWDAASSCHAKFKKEVISVPHKDQEQNFDIWYRSLWDWACDLQYFVWFFDEPWTANAFWNSQSSLPKDEGKPFAFIIYADKAKLFLFGFGGSHLVGWLPIVKEDKQYSGTQSFVNFKNVVWHELFKHLLKSIVLLSKTGCWVTCWDNIKCLLYPLILILLADYEKQCVMALIHGTKCKCPCPVCLIPREELGNVLTLYPLQTSVPMQATIMEARSFNVAHMDVHSAVSFDHLHFQECIKSVGQQIQSKINVHFDSMPRWCNINHFNHVMDISFSDSSKYEDISKLIVFAAHDVIDQGTHALPYLLLQCIHEYVNINMYAALEVHTLETIAMGRLAIMEFTQLLDHAYAHLFDDIKVKGATQNTNTKPNEKCHGPIRWIYLWWMNFKNIAEQVLCLDHCFLIAHSICLDIEDYDDLIASQKDPSYSSSADNDEHLDNDLDTTFHVKLGAVQNKQTFFMPDETVTEHHFVKVNYESIMDWCTTTDSGVIFGHLLMLFTCVMDGQTHPVALVHPYDAPVGQHSLKDKHFQFWHVHQRPRISSEFFSVHSIICGAALVEDHSIQGDYLVINTIDTDMFLCMKLMHKSAGHVE
ncbi:uncharacterized protein BJ212DRAFT_1446567 [Suillus subaureus]|uniref:Uncharacterized protein n=1 Tax=Suillus subaureus TaxID=48587 RepID=A0A9P7ED93_9AGAM|nr:uncharacterized protein BJ212DRAFT_1446567 [Suillus subaureus]KAG1818101.1 hypothetical protein BJ212DRAFT_1446567 [Suillus subaureus]